MKIDYSVPSYTKFYFCLDANIRYGVRNLELATNAALFQAASAVSLIPLAELVYHIAFGVLLLTPILGHTLALIDYGLHAREIRILHLRSTDPYEQGVEQGQALKSNIKLMCQLAKVINSLLKRGMLTQQDYEKRIPPDKIKELKGMAKGANLPYQELLLVNQVIEKLVGCSVHAMETKSADGQTNTLSATNHFTSQFTQFTPSKKDPGIADTFKRYRELRHQSPDNSIRHCINALRSVNNGLTVQSIVFDVNQKEIHLATGSGSAASRNFQHIKTDKIFGAGRSNESNFQGKIIKLARNLDFDFTTFLGPTTVMIVHPATSTKKSIATIGWAGMVGALSGMNEDGLSLAISLNLYKSPSDKENTGTPNQVLFREILEKASTTHEARCSVEGTKIGSEMNLVVAAPDGIIKMELDPSRFQYGSSSTTYTDPRK